MSNQLPGLDSLKSQAKRLRATLSQRAEPITHSQSLELIAHQYGYRDWNTLHAAVGNRPPPAQLALGQHVRGRYLGQPMAGRIIAIRQLAEGHHHVTIEFDVAVDVVIFESFSAYRKRINATVDANGVTAAKTSDGQPHLALDLG